MPKGSTKAKAKPRKAKTKATAAKVETLANVRLEYLRAAVRELAGMRIASAMVRGAAARAELEHEVKAELTARAQMRTASGMTALECRAILGGPVVAVADRKALEEKFPTKVARIQAAGGAMPQGARAVLHPDASVAAG